LSSWTRLAWVLLSNQALRAFLDSTAAVARCQSDGAFGLSSWTSFAWVLLSNQALRTFLDSTAGGKHGLVTIDIIA